VRAILHDAPGGPEALRLEDVPEPVPDRLDVVVAVRACALNRLDVVQREGWFRLPGFRAPHIPGMDVAGEVVALGADVRAVALGDRVVVDPSLAGVPEGSGLAGLGDRHGLLGVIGGNVDGGYAQRCLVPSTHVHRVPDHVPLEHAATFPTAWMTARHALFAVGGLEPGDVVLVHAAGAGVSVAAIQLARAAGATVLATASSERKCARARELGAAATCVHRDADVAAWAMDVTAGHGADVVLDHVGAALFDASLRALAVGGRLVTCGATSGDQATISSLGLLYSRGLRILGSDAYAPEEFAPAWRAFCDGGFEVVIDGRYPLEAAGEAQQRLLAGDVIGKLLLLP
jgi:NADPH:quinone reductase-like Zn-dependent oxidoreductase